MTELMEGHHAGARTGALLTDRAAGGLLLAFLATVIVVLAVATSLPPTMPAPAGESTEQTAVSSR
jgi:hypothetical protein